MKRLSALIASLVMILGMVLVATAPANAKAFCNGKVQRQTATKVVNVANGAPKTAGFNKWRKAVVTVSVRYNRCTDPAGRHRFDNVTKVNVKYALWKNNTYLGRSTTGGWKRDRNVNCRDGVRDDNWFKKVEAVWFESGFAGWNPPNYVVECQRDGSKSEGRRPPGGIKRVPASNHAHWKVNTTVVREGVRFNYNHNFHGEVR